MILGLHAWEYLHFPNVLMNKDDCIDWCDKLVLHRVYERQFTFLHFVNMVLGQTWLPENLLLSVSLFTNTLEQIEIHFKQIVWQDIITIASSVCTRNYIKENERLSKKIIFFICVFFFNWHWSGLEASWHCWWSGHTHMKNVGRYLTNQTSMHQWFTICVLWYMYIPVLLTMQHHTKSQGGKKSEIIRFSNILSAHLSFLGCWTTIVGWGAAITTVVAFVWWVADMIERCGPYIGTYTSSNSGISSSDQSGEILLWYTVTFTLLNQTR